ncbi:MAG: DMT family transporter [Acidimicrobiia bacterium]|nr:DMT family transporter [Acidimicrobiia bacterium]
MSTRRALRIPATRQAGVLLALATATISGFAVFLNGYAVRRFGDPTLYTTAKNAVAALLLMGLLAAVTTRHRQSSEALTLPSSRRGRWGLVLVGVIGGGIPFLLFFEGLARAESVQAAFIHKSLLLWVVLLAVPFLKEQLSWYHLAAIGLLVWGQVALVGGISDLRLGTGEAMILGATLLWSIEVVVAKRLLTDVSPLTLGVARMGVGMVVLVGWAAVSGAFGGLAGLGLSQWAWALLTGLVLTGYVATWYSALARAQAVDVSAVLVFGAVVTALLKSGVQGAAIPSVGGLVLVTMGVAAIVAATRGRPRSPART